MKISSLPTPDLRHQESPQLWQVSKDFEAMLTQQMIESMRKTVSRDGGLVPQSHAEKVYESMLDSDRAKMIADTEQLGLADVLYQQLLQQFGNR